MLLREQLLQLSYAIKKDDLPRVEQLFDANNQLFTEAFSRHPPICICECLAEFGKEAVCSYIIERHPDLALYITPRQKAITELVVLYQNITLLTLFVKQHPEIIHQPNEKGVTLLHIAVCKGFSSIVLYLLENGANTDPQIDNPNSNIPTPFDFAMQAESNYLVRLLLRFNAQCHYSAPRSWKHQPIHQAAIKNNVSLVRILLSFDPSLCNATDMVGQTTLVLAARHNSFDVVFFLITEFSDLLILNHPPEYKGLTALEWIQVCGEEQPVLEKALVKTGAKKTLNKCPLEHFDAMIAVSCGDLKILHRILTAKPYLLNWTDIDGNSLMIYAVIYDKPKIVRYLVDQGADTNIQFYNQGHALHECTALDIALNSKYPQTSLELILPNLPEPFRDLAKLHEDPINLARALNNLNNMDFFNKKSIQSVIEHPFPVNLAAAYHVLNTLCNNKNNELTGSDQENKNEWAQIKHESIERVNQCPRPYALAIALRQIHNNPKLTSEEINIIKSKLWKQRHPLQIPNRVSPNVLGISIEEYKMIQIESADSALFDRHFYKKSLRIVRREYITFFKTINPEAPNVQQSNTVQLG